MSTERDNKAGLVTAGHCTEALPWDGGVTNVAFYQPNNADPNHKIGNEKRDPFFSALPHCPNGKTCRRSDAAFIEFDSGVSYQRGYIAKPDAIGSIEVASGDQLKVKHEGGHLSVGHTLYRFGRTTGYRSGTIDDTCENTNEGNNRLLLCQHLITIVSGGGDSGAPYYKLAGSQTDVRLYGTHVGYDPSSGSRVISPLSGIYKDLGQSSTWDSCASPYNC